MTIRSADFQYLIQDAPRPGVVVVRMNRPNARNALSLALRAELVTCFDCLGRDPETRVAILTGSGSAFCAGLDLKELGRQTETLTSRDAINPISAIRRFPGVVIGAINGPALTGGLELALACDILVASSNACFGDTHARAGALPGWELSQRLSRTIGLYRAKHMAFTGQTVGADTALLWGLIGAVVEDHELMETALAIGEAVCAGERTSLIAYKRLIDEGYQLPLEEALLLERERAEQFNGRIRTSDMRDRAENLLLRPPTKDFP